MVWHNANRFPLRRPWRCSGALCNNFLVLLLSCCARSVQYLTNLILWLNIYFSIPIYSYFEVLRKRNNFISGVNSFCRSLHEVHRFPGYSNYHFFASQLGVDSRPLSSKNLKLEYLTHHMLFKILLLKKLSKYSSPCSIWYWHLISPNLYVNQRKFRGRNFRVTDF